VSRWFRLYADAMRNPKVMRLPDNDFRLWVRLLAVASENEGIIPPLDDLKLLLSARLDRLAGGLQRLINAGLVDVAGQSYTPHNWAKFQYKSDTSTPRVTLHRAKRNVSETPPDTETEAEQKDDDDVTREGLKIDLSELHNLAAEAARAGGVRHLEPATMIRHAEQVREWRDAGMTAPEIIAAIRDVTSRHTEPIHSLKFFDAHIRQTIARKDNPNGGLRSAVGGIGSLAVQPRARTSAALELVAEFGTAAVAARNQSSGR